MSYGIKACSTIKKTELGFQTLKDRQLALNARQRRLLLLIGTDDSNQMPVHYQQRIAEEPLLEQLMELGLIQPIQHTTYQNAFKTHNSSAFNTPKNLAVQLITFSDPRTVQEIDDFESTLHMPTMEVQYALTVR